MTEVRGLPAAATAAAATAVATTTTTVATAPAAAAAAATAAALRLGAGLVDGQVPAVDRGEVEAVDRRLGLGVTAHLDEAEPLGTSGVAVHDHLRRGDGAVGREDLLQPAVGHGVREVPDVQFLAHLLGLREKIGHPIRRAARFVADAKERGTGAAADRS